MNGGIDITKLARQIEREGKTFIRGWLEPLIGDPDLEGLLLHLVPRLREPTALLNELTRPSDNDILSYRSCLALKCASATIGHLRHTSSRGDQEAPLLTSVLHYAKALADKLSDAWWASPKAHCFRYFNECIPLIADYASTDFLGRAVWEALDDSRPQDINNRARAILTEVPDRVAVRSSLLASVATAFLEYPDLKFSAKLPVWRLLAANLPEGVVCELARVWREPSHPRRWRALQMLEDTSPEWLTPQDLATIVTVILSDDSAQLPFPIPLHWGKAVCRAPELVHRLIAGLMKSKRGKGEIILKSLRCLGPEAGRFPELITILSTSLDSVPKETPLHRRSAAWSSVPPLQLDEDEVIRTVGYFGKAAVRDARIVENLAWLTSNWTSFPLYVEASIQAIGRLAQEEGAPQRLVPQLLALLDSHAPYVAGNAIDALVAMGDRAACEPSFLPHVLSLLNEPSDTHEFQQGFAVSEGVRLHPEQRIKTGTKVIDWLSVGSSYSAEHAIVYLSTLADEGIKVPQAEDKIRACLHESNWHPSPIGRGIKGHRLPDPRKAARLLLAKWAITSTESKFAEEDIQRVLNHPEDHSEFFHWLSAWEGEVSLTDGLVQGFRQALERADDFDFGRFALAASKLAPHIITDHFYSRLVSIHRSSASSSTDGSARALNQIILDPRIGRRALKYFA